jgi:hypothetical protein
MESRLHWELDSTHGQRLGPPLIVFHTQLIWRAWFFKQISTGQTRVIAAPDFCHGLDTFDMHNNLSWLPSVSNVPVLQAPTSRNLGQGSGARGGGWKQQSGGPWHIGKHCISVAGAGCPGCKSARPGLPRAKYGSLLNYSHSRNPPCAPARMHGRTQAPREPPN